MLKKILYCVKCANLLMFLCHGFQVVASLDCDFEDGLCNWQNSGDFDWQLEFSHTQSSGTGPSSDHTAGGYRYIYIEASGKDEGDKAILSSPVQENGPYCLTFWYNMYGINIGALNVYMKLSGGSKILLLRKDRNLGNNDWRKAVINIDVNDSYQIVLEGVRGNGSKGDIAIDDISMKYGRCFVDLASLDCNFEDGLCNWQQEDSDDFDWLRGSGDTPSSDTGPSSDHTTGDDGHYIYIKATDQDKEDKAVISSPVQESGPFCLTFWYNMYGNDIGALNVYMILNGGNITLLLTKGENHGLDDWRKAVITNNATDTYRIAFEGVRGDGFKGDIAVDDISIIPTLCTLDLVSLDCNFEDGLCNWQQENSDDFDWLRESGDTPSSDTGPSSDHTTGDDGHYIYIEATDQDKEDKAVISSPVQNSGPFCLTFWYNMYGTDIGALKVYMILNGGNKSLLFAKSKNHGRSVWRKAVISNNATDTYRIAFEGVRGDDFKGDIAVDDISVIPTLCSLDCSFEDGLCNWHQDDSDDFDWLRESGDTPSSHTGPSSDHTTGDDGYYIYIEATNKDTGDKAVISSPVQESGPYCLTFWYNMYGNDIGSLNVYMKVKDGNKIPLLTKYENHGNNDWRKAVINNNATNKYQIVFEGIRGDGIKGDIAVDDISMIHGRCFVDLTSLDCNFEDGLCNWQQAYSDNFDWLRESGDTQTYGTGPNYDHTTGYGWYVYIDSSTHNSGETAWLVSPLQNAGKYCFSFWYYMYGEDMGRLRVLHLPEQGTAKEIFTRSSASDRKWIRENISLHSKENFKIIFEGRVKEEFSWRHDEGDIAIDDVHMVSCQDCENPTPAHAYANSTNFSYGSVIKITCNVGYDITGESLIICQKNRSWSAMIPSCNPFDCENPTPAHAYANSTNFSHGSVIKITCNVGYDITGESLIICQKNRSWSATIPSCNPFDCGNRTINNGIFIAPEGTTLGQTGTHVCNIGYSLVGDASISCTASGWNSTDASCKPVDCGKRSISNGAFIASDGTTYGKTATQICNKGFSLTGDTAVICTSIGWNGTMATCNIIDCGHRTLLNGQFSALDGTSFGKIATHVCNTGYILVGYTNVTCTESGWKGTVPTCELIDCGHRTLLNGQFSALDGTTFGKIATHVCNTGYILVGDTNVTCTESGWKGTIPTCELIETENDALIAVYVLVPVVVVILLVLFTVICFRRSVQKCKKVKERNPVMAVPNKTYTGVASESQTHINHAYEDGSVQLNDEYTIITDEQNVNSDNLNYNIAGAAGTSKEHDTNNYDHIKETAAHFVDESYSHVSRNKSGTTFEPSYNTTLHPEAGNASFRTHTQSDMNSHAPVNINNCNETEKQRNETENGKESDYDQAHANGINPSELDEDDYSHLNNNIGRTEKKVEKSEAGCEQERGLAWQYKL